MLLAFLNLGASEIILILLLLLLLFGADKVPQLARSLGKARAELERAKGQFSEAMKTEEERAWDQQLAFERERERKVLEAVEAPAGAGASEQAAAAPERRSLVDAAEAMGLQTQGLTDAELKAAIAAKLGK